ncbi:e4ffe9ac-fdc4-4186-b1a7-aa4197092985-CDS [Sclerotinia trifoliorum]|uniref:E4ffe9ac-fdc4-4186-b1a7-aa4197092985-CDS n=1 Tax=Sclerotinia trifoliorum TaxID=28548 RepID=A0A8H2W0K6_9HELO|nr:e4ffe9ac-fdc4-4186-b1a7-aa4197092985-CDS [Sclerotinia trifoliorum]
MVEQIHRGTTSSCRGRLFGRSLNLITDLPSPHQQPCYPHYIQNPPNLLNPAYPVSVPTLPQYNQTNSFSALPLTQNHLFEIVEAVAPQTQPLHPEHNYLLLSLSRENLKALSLRQKIAAAEASLFSLELASGVDGPGIAALSSAIANPLTAISTTQVPTRRKLKKQISWLKCRIKECSRQERIITERLHQIGEEEERRWRWMHIERQTRINAEMLGWQKGYWDSIVRCGTAAGYGHGFGHEYGYGHGQWDRHLNANTPASQAVASGVAAHGSESQCSSAIREQSNGFWNTDALQTGERLSRGWDECDLSPLAEERAGLAEGWTTDLGNGEAEKKGEDDDELDTGEGSGSGSGEVEGEGEGGGHSATETAITTPTPQQSARMTPMTGAKSCNDVKLAFCDGTLGNEKEFMDLEEPRDDMADGMDRREDKGEISFLFMKDGVLRERKCKSLPWVDSKRLIEVYAGKEEGKKEEKEKEKEKIREEEDGTEGSR